MSRSGPIYVSSAKQALPSQSMTRLLPIPSVASHQLTDHVLLCTSVSYHIWFLLMRAGYLRDSFNVMFVVKDLHLIQDKRPNLC